LAMAAVDQYRQFHHCRPPQVGEGVEGGADRPARVEDVVDQDHRAVGDVGGYGRAGEVSGGASIEVVAVEADVEFADRHRRPLEALDGLGNGGGQGRPPGVDPHQDDPLGAVVAFDDFVGDAVDGAPDVVGVQNGGC